MKIFTVSALMCLFAAGCATKTAAPVSANTELQQTLIEGKRSWELGKLDEAEISFRNVLAVETNNAAAAYYLALVHREQIDHRRPAIFTYHKTVVTNYLRMPLEQRTLASFGHFDSNTTVEDVINRVGPPDMELNISGIYLISYALPPPDTNGIQIDSPGGSFISSVKHGETFLYERGSNDW
jgi:hypothetical protein